MPSKVGGSVSLMEQRVGLLKGCRGASWASVTQDIKSRSRKNSGQRESCGKCELASAEESVVNCFLSDQDAGLGEHGDEGAAQQGGGEQSEI